MVIDIMDCKKANYKKNSTGSAITEAQIKLSKKVGKKNKVYYTGKIDGYFGPMMDAAVRNYQKDNNLVVDGFIGPITCNSLGLNTVTPVIKAIVQPNTNTSNAKKKKNELLALVFAQPNNYFCGPTSLCICFSVFDIVRKENFLTNVHKIAKLANTSEKTGTNPPDLDKSVNKFNKDWIMDMEKYVSMDTIAKHIDNREPIVAHGATIPELGYTGSFGHYITCVGYDYDNNLVKIIDPFRTQFGTRWVHLSIFKKFLSARNHPTPLHFLKKK